ncbi:sensor histidine kinase [Methanomicrobium antiquum]|uniref:histidine kinase n=1 Tax=Methanomicrobium antiquum TaxID=487686 RepID=A0AAF0FPS2_9EURY|nr:sensor histidine kinase [Methanomicrobium antiquum]WFN36359.1 sensor histidine kinase [Methanomicrobium antiquum]
MDLDSYEKLNLPSEFSEPLIVYSEGDDEISLISPVYSIEDEIAGYIKVTNERELFRLGFGSLLLNFIFAIITCIVVVIIISYFLESIITRRLEFFSYELEKIAENENYNVRLREEGDDEISSIIRSANILLDKIQGSVESLEEKNLELSRVLDKKSELIGELHHRVKNNLQYIISLLGIKSLRIKDEIALDVINEATNRIKYLGIIHDDLYNKEDKATLLLKENFESLAKLILDGLKQEKREKISIKISGDEIEAKLSNAVLLSTAMYELLKNSVDHAFDETGGNIEISLKEDKKEVIIKVCDDGVGMKKQRCIGETGFGLRNARDIITKQISGTLESTDMERGTSWIITIKTEFIKGKQENGDSIDNI